MGFTLIRPASRPFLAREHVDAAAVADADRIAGLLRNDYQRWSRWGVGVGAFAAAVAGAFITGGMIDTIQAFGGALYAVDLVITVLAAVVAAAGSVTLIRLWVTGRALASATARWQRVPYTHAGRVRRAGGWVGARTANFDPPIFARLTSAALALLLGIGGVAVAVRDIVDGEFAVLSASVLIIGVIGLLSGAGQMGGVIRIVSGLSEGDPLWYRIRSALTRQ